MRTAWFSLRKMFSSLLAEREEANRVWLLLWILPCPSSLWLGLSPTSSCWNPSHPSSPPLGLSPVIFSLIFLSSLFWARIQKRLMDWLVYKSIFISRNLVFLFYCAHISVIKNKEESLCMSLLMHVSYWLDLFPFVLCTVYTKTLYKAVITVRLEFGVLLFSFNMLQRHFFHFCDTVFIMIVFRGYIILKHVGVAKSAALLPFCWQWKLALSFCYSTQCYNSLLTYAECPRCHRAWLCYRQLCTCSFYLTLGYFLRL